MKAFFAQEQARHNPAGFLQRGVRKPNPERPERTERLLAGARAAGCSVERPGDFGLALIARVHTPEYLEFLQSVHGRWQEMGEASGEVIPNVHPVRQPNSSYPASAVGQAGYHMADTSCPITAATWTSACWSAWTAAAAAEAVLAGGRSAYALCRPPGHHAFADMAGGFCYLNSAAIAAEHLRGAAKRVAILDVDLHHGNGTQGVFYARADVLTVSIHADPANFYPYFWGFAQERGTGAGEGCNCNLPLPLKSGDAVFLEALEAALRRIRAFAPDALVVALGLDAFAGDPFGGLSVSTDGFARIAQEIAGLGLPSVLVQEGGYLCPELSDNLRAFLCGLGEKNG